MLSACDVIVDKDAGYRSSNASSQGYATATGVPAVIPSQRGGYTGVRAESPRTGDTGVPASAPGY